MSAGQATQRYLGRQGLGTLINSQEGNSLEISPEGCGAGYRYQTESGNKVQKKKWIFTKGSEEKAGGPNI